MGAFQYGRVCERTGAEVPFILNAIYVGLCEFLLAITSPYSGGGTK